MAKPEDAIFAALQPLGVPIKYQIYAGKAESYVTFFDVVEVVALNADNQAVYNKHRYQIDIWSQNSLESLTLYRKARSLITAAGFYFVSKQDLYEYDTKTYHIAMDMYLVEEA